MALAQATQQKVTSLDQAYNVEHLLESFNTIQMLFKNTFDKQTDCPYLDEKKSNLPCLHMCKVFSQNNNAPYSYVNSNGGKIPNMALRKKESDFRSCFFNIQSKNLEQNIPQIPFSNQQKKNIELLKEVKRTNSLEAYIALQSYIANVPLKAQLGGGGFSPPNSSEIKKDLEDAFKNCNCNLPETVKKKFLSLSIPDHPQTNTQLNIESNPLYKSYDKNPFLNPLLATDIKIAGSKKALLKHQQTIKKAEERVNKIFSSTKKDVISMLDIKAKQQPQFKKQYNEMKKRVSSVKFFPNHNSYKKYATKLLGGQQVNSCAGGPNAFYNPAIHSASVCPQMLEYPEISIKEILSHEIAHSIDPCNMAAPLLKIQQKNNIQLQNNNPAENIYIKPSIVENLSTASSTAYIVEKLSTASSTASIVSTPVNFENSPAFNTVKCLSKKNSLNIRRFNKEEIIALVNKEIKKNKDFNANSRNHQLTALIKSKKDIQNNFYNLEACNQLPNIHGVSQISEGWSDWLGAEVVAMHISKAPEKEKFRLAFESIAGKAGFYGCNTTEIGYQKNINDFIQKAGCIQKKSTYEILDEVYKHNISNHHGSSPDRLNAIIRAHPIIKGALGCVNNATYPKKKYCE